MGSMLFSSDWPCTETDFQLVNISIVILVIHDMGYISLVTHGYLALKNILIVSTTKARINKRNKTLINRISMV